MKKPNQHALAAHTWEFLVTHALRRQQCYYSELAAELGTHHRAVRFPLELIQDYCLQGEKPPLTILVINQNTGLPGTGFIGAPTEPGALRQNRLEVFEWPWQVESNPFAFAHDGMTTEEDVVRRILDQPEEASRTYELVGNRGAIQSAFRKALLKAYEGRCAISGSTLEDALDAAHIVPWSRASHAERISVQNGLLLNTYFHRLLDCGVLQLGEDYVVRLDPEYQLQGFSSFDQQVLGAVIDQPIRLPKRIEHHPDKSLIRQRNERES